MDKGTILVVDDEERILELFRGIFVPQYDVLTASSGPEALELVSRQPVHVLLADYHMEGMTGSELLVKVREKYPEIVRMLITGYPDIDALADAINRGQIYGFIRKPWEVAELRIFIKQAYDHYRVLEENRRLTAELRKDNFSLHNIIQSLVSGLMVVDTSYKIYLINPAAAKLFGLDSQSARGHQVTDFPTLAPLLPIIRETLSSVHNLDYQEIEMQANGETRMVGFGTTLVGFGTHPLFGNDDSLQGVIVLCRDITEKKRLEEQLIHSEKLAAIGLLAGGVAHEIKNPLSVILGYSELLLESKPDEKTANDSLLKIQRQAERCRTIVGNLLKFSRKSDVDIVPINVNQTLSETLELLGKQLLVQNIKVVTEYSSMLPPYWGNESELQQIFFNLIVNAKDAMEKTGGTLTIKTVNSETTIRVVIQDSGPGVPPEIQQKIFQPFFTTKESGKGTGLGLAIVQNIVDKYRGTLSLESRPGEGAAFHITLPKHEQGDVKPKAEEAQLVAEDQERLRVMLVDDEDDIRALCKEIFLNDNHIVSEFSSGFDAIEAVKSERVDIVFLDLKMPKISGIDTFKRLKAIQPGLPVVIVTGSLEDSMAKEVFGLDAFDIIDKPFKVADLKKVIKKYHLLRGKRTG
ncbi:MAG: response regulator [Candidatus Riflebacteria bacterium]|nr:response regulator [Candidatus Riflebacteria bacterium]